MNDFIDRGRVKKVYVMSEAKYRMLPDDIGDWYVRAADGQMVPFSAFSSSRWEYGSPRLERYNGLPSMEILGQAAPGKSTGEAMELMEQLASKLPTVLAMTGRECPIRNVSPATRRLHCTRFR